MSTATSRLSQLWLHAKMRMQHRFRLLLVDEVGARTTGSYRFTLGRLLLLGVCLLAGVIALTVMAIFYTPLRETVPGYTDPDLVMRQKTLLRKVAGMEQRIAQQDSFILSIQRASGYTSLDTVRAQARALVTDSGLTAVPHAPALPRGILATQPQTETLLSLRWPVFGFISQGYNPAERHYAIDIAADSGALVRTVAAGTIILTEYSAATGYVVGVQHAGGLVSFYKHNNQLLARVGDYVFHGEAIAVIGNAGEQSTGPHLHFELWVHGSPVDPVNYLPGARRSL